MKKTGAASCSVRPRLRVLAGAVIAFGPGKADLLEAIQQTGSITQAAARLKMSYMRAWTLIRTMNGSFREPLVVAARGDTKGGGGARLTATGIKILDLYRRMEARALSSARPDWEKFQKLLKKGSAPKR